MKRLVAIAFCIGLTALCYGQHAAIRGTIIDTSQSKHLAQSVIALLYAKDSILYRFTRSSAIGRFELGQLQAGRYLLLVSTPQYADYVDSIRIDGDTAVEYGNVYMTTKAHLLEGVVVRQSVAAIRMRGDTTEYTADSFHVQQYASVEDLLKKLPGIQVDKNGKISAYGKDVEKVLVDGEEFFGDDPTLVTQNLRANMIDKVQVFEKKSDQAAFTGIDDGVKTQTINLKLKEDRKKGYFGKLAAAGGTDGYNDSQAMINFFRGKEKAATYGIVSNTGKTGLDWNEKSNYGSGGANNLSVDDVTGMYTVEGEDDLGGWDGRYNNRGYPTAKAAGAHYNNKWNDDKKALNADYQMLQLGVNGTNASASQYSLPDSMYYQRSGERFSNLSLRQRLSGIGEWKTDSSSTIKLTASGNTEHKTSESYTNSVSLDEDSLLVNANDRRNIVATDSRSFNGNMLWMKRLPKKGRTLSLNLSGNYRHSEGEGHLYALTSYYQKGAFASQDTVDQLKSQLSKNAGITAKATYTEPVSAVSSLGFSYSVNINNSNAVRSSYNAATPGKYEQLDSVYSSNYLYNVSTHSGGLVYSVLKKKFRLRAGGSAGFTTFNQEDKLRGGIRRRSFANWAPSVNSAYSFSTNRQLSFEYSGRTRQPDINQIQPLKSNENPLYIYNGNPDLKPEFSNSLSVRYNDYHTLSGKSLNASVSFNFSQNAIGTKSVIDSKGVTTAQSVNINGNRSAYLYLRYGFDWKAVGLRLAPGVNVNMGRAVNYANGLLNITHNNTYTGRLSAYKQKDDKYDLSLEASAAYTSNTASVKGFQEQQYWTFQLRPYVFFHLPLKLELNTDMDYTIRQKTPVFTTNNNVLLWNASLGRRVLSDKSLLIKISVNDLLNQNIGFNRYGSNNAITQSSYSTIRRYALVSAVWNFTKAGGKK